MEKLLEICANSFASAVAAEQGGADRIELCDNLPEGGTTPAYETIHKVKQQLKIPVFVLIRPRPGDFIYSDEEFELIKSEIGMCHQLGCEGVVFGILTAEAEIDSARCRELINLAIPMQTTFHRAFDEIEDQQKALEELIDLGFDRVLTSGGAEFAADALQQLKTLVLRANNRIIIMPGSGINPGNIKLIANETGANEFHTSAKKLIVPVSTINIPKYQTDKEIVI
ncbi:MAG: copper homeostasis protein CutC, partial [Daejeonella sp.]